MTEAPPRVSVICAFLNAERFIEQTIESVLGQDFGDFELLLIDDGSSDGSSAIARRCARAHSHVRYLEHAGHANFGTTASRNAGLRAARGELVAFIDADDVWRPSKLREQTAILARLPEVDAVCGAVNFWASPAGGEDKIIPTGHVQNRVIEPTEGLSKIYPLGRADPPCPSDLLMRRSIVEKIGGFEETFVGPLQLYEDQAFLAKFFLEGRLFCSDQVWLDYRVHAQSCTSRVTKKGLGPDMRRHCLEWFEDYVRGTRHWRNPAVRWALIKALRPYRHPHLSSVARRLRRFLRPARWKEARA